MSLEITVRYDKKVRDQLVTLRRHTGLPHYHTLCRWAFCLSIADATPLREHQLGSTRESGKESGEKKIETFELPWLRFGQADAAVLESVLRNRAVRDGMEPSKSNLQNLAQGHIRRGMSRLMAGKRIRSIEDLARIAVEAGRRKPANREIGRDS